MSLARMMQMAAAGSAGAGPEPSGWTDPDLANASYDSVSFSVAGQSTLPVGLCFSPDGKSMYVSDYLGTIFQYTLSTAFDMSTASYASKSFVSGLGANIRDCFISEDGSSFYIADQGGADTVAQFSLSTNFDISSATTPASATFSVAAQDGTLCSIFFKPDGTKMYVCGTAQNTVFQYSLSTAYDVSTASYDSLSLNVSAKEANARSIFLSPDGTYLLVGGSSSDSVHGYSLSLAWDVSSASFVDSFSMASQETDLNAIWVSSNGSKVFGLGLITDTIYQYSTAAAAPAEWTDPDLANASYDSVSFSVAGQETSPESLFFKPDGTKMYVMGYSGDNVNEYDLSTAWDITTASFLQVFSVVAREGAPRGLFFKPDGTKMYVMGTASVGVNEYDLSTAWDVSTATYLQFFSVGAQESSPRGLFFKPDGTKMYVTGATGDDVNEYDLSTAWDVTTASFLQVFSVAAQDTLPTWLLFNPSGTKMYILGSTGDDVNEYDLSTAWDVSTAVYNSVSFSVAAQETSPTSLFFKSDGSKLYVIGLINDTIYQYSTT